MTFAVIYLILFRIERHIQDFFQQNVIRYLYKICSNYLILKEVLSRRYKLMIAYSVC